MFAILNSIWQSSWGIGLNSVTQEANGVPIPLHSDNLDVIAFIHDIE